MPLFSSSSSKFAFKKTSSSRRRRPKRSPVAVVINGQNRRKYSDDSVTDSSATTGSSSDGDDETTSTTVTENSKAKKIIKSKKIKRQTNRKASRNKDQIDNGLILNVGDRQQHCFRFDQKHGIWKSLMKCGQKQPPESVIKPTDDVHSNHPINDESINELIDSVKSLKEENRLLKLKIEILIEMVTETTAELNLKDGTDGGGNVNKSVAKRLGSTPSSSSYSLSQT